MPDSADKASAAGDNHLVSRFMSRSLRSLVGAELTAPATATDSLPF